jgi:hypothetical protein
MREAALGHWIYFTWHLPALLFVALGTLLVVASARSLRRDHLRPFEAALRWRILGWSSLGACLALAIAWPYLHAFSKISVQPDGSWRVSNYLGVPLARVPAGEVRELRGVDLGGLGLGVGHLEIRRGDGSVLRSVRLDRATLEQARRALGYPTTMVRDQCGDRVILAHAYTARGPR